MRRGTGEAFEDNYTTFLEGDNENWTVLRIEVEPIEEENNL